MERKDNLCLEGNGGERIWCSIGRGKEAIYNQTQTTFFPQLIK